MIYDFEDRLEAVNGTIKIVPLPPEAQKELSEKLHHASQVSQKRRISAEKKEKWQDFKDASKIGLLVFIYTLLMSLLTE